MSRYTKGPWVFDGESTVFDDRKRDPVCNVDYCCPQEDQANGRLIAAAPDLLEALIELEEYVGRLKGGTHDSLAIYNKAGRAIAKALTP
jgi:hypothetical protein